MMLWKNRNKKVGLCVMIVTSFFILAAIWAIMATPETALAKGNPASGVNYKMVIDTENFTHQSAPLLTDNGDGSAWTFFTRITVTPTGSDYPIGVGKIGVVVVFKEQKGVINSLTIAGNDADRVWHVSDVIPVDPPIISNQVNGTNFEVVINADNVDVHRKNKSGPVIGTIAIGTIRFTVVP
jgi:hypothetical protein